MHKLPSSNCGRGNVHKLPSPTCGTAEGSLRSSGAPYRRTPCGCKGRGEGRKCSPTPRSRSNQTEAEARLWYHLRAHRFMGLKFKRQKPVGRYIADFVCCERRLIVELDGQHAEQVHIHRQRDAWLRSQGYTVLRFWNNDVMQQLEGVLEQIRCAVSVEPSPLE